MNRRWRAYWWAVDMNTLRIEALWRRAFDRDAVPGLKDIVKR